MPYIYQLTPAGQAVNLRWESDNYSANPSEFVIQGLPGTPLPAIESLHSSTYLVDSAKGARQAVLAVACEAAILGGFTSNALGATYTYPLGLTDQINLSGEVEAAKITGPSGVYAFICADNAGGWARRPHTDVQIIQVGLDARAWVKAQLAHLDALRATVAAATTVVEVEAVVW